mmetsp:Transcript_8238/g.24424  ORF Transcript_8238/g.24424 Transcript_8238/m.24424 type:complete len:646 (-) Transcript_8238:1922-3859(-)
MLLAYSNRLVDLPLRRICLHGHLRLPGLQEKLLRLRQVVLVDAILALVHEDLLDPFPVVRLGHAHRGRPVALVDVHVDGLLRLRRLDELFLGESVVLVVLQCQCLLQVDVRHLVLGRLTGELESVLEVAVLDGVVDGDLHQAVLRQEHRARLRALVLDQAVRLRKHNFLERRLAAMDLGDMLRFLPLLQAAVHAHGAGPHLGLHEIMLCLLEVPLKLVLLRDVLICVVEQLLAVFGNEPQHLLVLLTLLVHVDGKVEIIDHEVHLLGFDQLALLLQALRKRDVQLLPDLSAQVRLGHLVRLLELRCVDVHLDGTLGAARLDEGPLGLVVLPQLRIVRGQLLVRGQRELRFCGSSGDSCNRCVEQLLGLVPLLGSHRGFDGLRLRAGLDVMVDRGVHLPLRGQPITALLLERDDEPWRVLLRQLDGLPVRVAPAERVHRWGNHAHPVVQLAGLLVHAAGNQSADDFVQQFLRVLAAAVPVHHRRGLRGHAAVQVELDRAHVIALCLLLLAGPLLLLRGEQPLEVVLFQVRDLWVVLPLRQPDGVVELVELLVHRQRLVQLVVVQQNGLGPLEALGEDRDLGLRHVVVRAVDTALLGVLLDDPVHLVEIAALGDVAEHCVAPLRDWQIKVLHGGVCQGPPHRLGLGC